MNTARILVVDDDPGNGDYISRILSNFIVNVSSDPKQAIETFNHEKYDLIISDQKMPGISGIKLIKTCREQSDDFLGLIISAYTDSEDLIDAVNSNVIYKYIIKPFTPDILLQHVHRAVESLFLMREKTLLEEQLKEENKKLKTFHSHFGLSRLAGNSPLLVELKNRISTYANSESPVLITGETGTGKELIAQSFHELSARNKNALVKINCTTLSSGLFESELFGYVKGAFTGADQATGGFFEAAHGGSIFLDEIGDLSLEMQPKLLRVLQFGTFYPVGGRKEKKVDVRIIASTNVNIEELVSEGKFREDLYHRLNILRLRIPPLRDRKEDIPEIFHFINQKEYGNEGNLKISKEAFQILINHPFTGNVRELETYVHRLRLLYGNETKITADQMKTILEPVRYDNSIYLEKESNLKADIEHLEKETIFRTLEENHYNISKSAGILGVSRQGLHNKIKRYNLKVR